MAVVSRQVKNKKSSNGVSTGRSGTVYDVTIRYRSPDGYKTYGKRGFATKQEALKYEAEMKVKLENPTFQTVDANTAKQTVKEYLDIWVEAHGRANLRPSTYDSYKGYIRNHIAPAIGRVRLNQLTPAMIDALFQQLFAKGLSQSSVRYAQRILSVALEHARKYHYIESNPARDIITKFGKQGKTPDPYTIKQMQQLFSHVVGTAWEMAVMLGGLYGLRLGEIVGLRWRNVDMINGVFSVVEQVPFKVPPGTTTITEMAPVKSEERDLPITATARLYFEQQLRQQACQKELAKLGGTVYYDNDLVFAKPNGILYRRDSLSTEFAQMLRHSGLPHIRFHDLRHTAATNMHQLTGDFYTVGKILGHSLKGMGLQLGISTNLEATTAQYVDVRLERKKTVLDTYHNALFPAKENESGPQVIKKKSHDRER